MRESDIIDGDLPSESLTRGLDDYCECLHCGFVGLVRAGADTCPACNAYGNLVDRSPPWLLVGDDDGI